MVHVFAYIHACLHTNAHISNELYFGIRYILGQAIGWDTYPHHTACHREFFKNIDFMSLEGQVISTGYTCRARTYDRDLAGFG